MSLDEVIDRKMLNSNTSKRNSSLELLRIICMILIIMHHYAVYGGWGEFNTNNLSGNVIFVQILQLGGKMACHIFMVITGFFMINSKVNYKKILLIIFEMLCYSVGIMIAFYCFNSETINLKMIIKSLFPVFWGNWFLIYYVILLFLIPFINPIIHSLPRKKLLDLIILLILIYSVIPTFTGGSWKFSSLDNFIIMYFIGAYIRLYNLDFQNKKVNIVGMIISLTLLIVSVPTMNIIAKISGSDIFINKAVYFGNEYSILSVLSAIFIFLVFKEMKFESKIINWIASSVLGIYLIHDNSIIRSWLWTEFYPNMDYFTKDSLFFHAFIKITLIFVICLIIDKVRIYLVENPIKKLLDRKWNIFYNKYSNLLKSKNDY